MTITITIDFECPRWLRRSFALAGAPLIVLGATTLVFADVTVPNTFQEGQVVSADQMNQNFKAVATPVGAVIAYFGTIATAGSPPDGWLLADGTEIDSQARPELAALVSHLRAMGPSYQGASPTKAFKPDLRGVFLRGQDRGAGVNPDKGADEIGRWQADAFQSHYHMLQGVAAEYYPGADDVLGGPYATRVSSYKITQTQAPADGNVAGETRPKNITVVYLIKY